MHDLSVHQPVSLIVRQSTCLTACLPVCLSVCLSVCTQNHHTDGRKTKPRGHLCSFQTYGSLSVRLSVRLLFCLPVSLFPLCPPMCKSHDMYCLATVPTTYTSIWLKQGLNKQDLIYLTGDNILIRLMGLVALLF